METYSTAFYFQNETLNEEIHQEFFEELNRKSGAKCTYERAWKFQAPDVAGRREMWRNGGEGALLRT